MILKIYKKSMILLIIKFDELAHCDLTLKSKIIFKKIYYPLIKFDWQFGIDWIIPEIYSLAKGMVMNNRD